MWASVPISEYQLSRKRLEKDVGFGPKNLGLSQEEIDRRVQKAILSVACPGSASKSPPSTFPAGRSAAWPWPACWPWSRTVLELD